MSLAVVGSGTQQGAMSNTAVLLHSILGSCVSSAAVMTPKLDCGKSPQNNYRFLAFMSMQEHSSFSPEAQLPGMSLFYRAVAFLSFDFPAASVIWLLGILVWNPIYTAPARHHCLFPLSAPLPPSPPWPGPP